MSLRGNLLKGNDIPEHIRYRKMCSLALVRGTHIVAPRYPNAKTYEMSIYCASKL